MRVLKWTELSALGKSRWIASFGIWFAIVPVAAKLFTEDGRQFHINVFGIVFDGSVGLPFSWRVFFFSALCFTIANLIYQLACPGLIKNYQSFSDFEAREKSRYKLRLLVKEEFGNLRSKRVSERLHDKRESLVNILWGDFLGTTDDEWGSLPREESGDFLYAFIRREENLPDVFAAMRSSIDTSRWGLRLHCMFFYAVGILLIGWLVLQNIWYVTQSTF